MAIYKFQKDKIAQLQNTTFANERIDEVHDMQKYIINSTHIIGEDLFVLSSEYSDWEDSKRRIDILCIDKDANLVVVELKRTDNGGHMELQSIRYAAMIANMTFDKAVKAYESYIEKNNILVANPEDTILNFLEWDNVYQDNFARDIRIILVSADFSKEITTSVLWLNERGIDIRCIRIKPQKDGDNLYLDIQQIIPLPETADYQVKFREKVVEQRQVKRENGRDYSKSDVSINGISKSNLNKRQTMFFVISESVKSGISPQNLMKITGANRWLWVDKKCTNKEEFEAEIIKIKTKYDTSRWFNNDDELLVYENKTYVFSNQQGGKIHDLVIAIFEQYPDLNGIITKNELEII